jgi:hypothetical protein
MAKGLSKNARQNIEKCRSAAVAAVDSYNRPGPSFRTAHFIVLIVLAWTALFHAVFYKRRVNPWYKKAGKSSKGDRYIRIDGDPKHWDLSECLKQYFGGDHPAERKNLEFLIGLRNKIEHRHLPALDAGLYGECQACLLNLEDFLTKEFGQTFAMAEQLTVALQFTQLVPTEKKKAAAEMAGRAAKSVRDYVEKFRGGLNSTVLNSQRYSFNVFLVPKAVTKKELADAAVEFIKVDESNKDEVERLEKLNVLIREKHIPIQNLDLLKPTQVVPQVQAAIPFRFNIASHAASWQHFKVRPMQGAAKPEATDARYCIFDKAHKDYLYTAAWVAKLTAELATEEKFKEITGLAAILKQ